MKMITHLIKFMFLHTLVMLLILAHMNFFFTIRDARASGACTILLLVKDIDPCFLMLMGKGKE